ncbi:MAG: hypothetical protein IJK18_02505 [Clostridia bacterium]|nr:hypothetical protein [Clostridia bacterium]
MKDLLKTNCFDTQETMIIVGSCLESMQPKAYSKYKNPEDVKYTTCKNPENVKYITCKNPDFVI